MSLASTLLAPPSTPPFTTNLAVPHCVFTSSTPATHSVKPNASRSSLEEAISVLEFAAAQAIQFNMIRVCPTLLVLIFVNVNVNVTF